jgi:hypothetical protein
MTEVSLYYVHSNRNPRYIAFVKYEKFIKVILSDFHAINFTIENFMSVQQLFEFYILSQITTKDLDKINHNKNLCNEYSISVEYDWKLMYCLRYYTDVRIDKFSNNPMNSKEPKRQTSDKKIRKFIKNFNTKFNHDPIDRINVFIDTKCRDDYVVVKKYEKYIENEKNVSIFTGIKRKYGSDIYNSILKFM